MIMNYELHALNYSFDFTCMYTCNQYRKIYLCTIQSAVQNLFFVSSFRLLYIFACINSHPTPPPPRPEGGRGGAKGRR
jgi:hypothetical protein